MMQLPRHLPWLCLCFLPLPGLAQQVKIVGPVWAGPRPTPDSLPPLKSFDATYPRDARQGGEIGYVLVREAVDASGRTMERQVAGNLAVFEHSVDHLADWRIAPALRSGQPVDSRYRFAVIFNPASAAEDKPDATPRLLSVGMAAIAVLSDEFPSGADHKVIDATLHLNEKGQVVDLDLPAALTTSKAEVLRQLRVWHFAPARQTGRPVAAAVQLPLVVQPRQAARPPATVRQPTHMPVAVRQPYPRYPDEMRWSQLTGKVLVEFIVDHTGSVQAAFVKESNNPGFDDAALEAVRLWKFKPATTEDGTPVATKVDVPIIFQFEYGGGYDVFAFLSQPAKTPPQLQYDVAPKATSVVFPVYPFELLRDDVGGQATVAFLINSHGQIVHTVAVKSSRPEFAAALAAALAADHFDPALRKGEVTATIARQEQDFSPSEKWIGPYSPQDERRLLRELEKHPEKIVAASKLDEGVRPLALPLPIYPPNLLGRGTAGEALLEIIIDEAGRVHLPRIVSASQPEFGYAAAQAVAAWNFSVPKVGGQPVLTRIQVPFRFSAR